MILRRSRAADAGLVLGPALALTLPLGMPGAAQAQTPPAQMPFQMPAEVSAPAPAAAAPAAVPDADTLRQRDQELDAIRAQQRESTDSQSKLRLQIEALGRDRRALNEQLIDSAARVRAVEAKIEATEARLRALDERESVFQKSLDERRAVIIEILAALQRVGRRPPPALLVRPEDALQALRTAITLGAVVPEMRTEAEALAGDLADLVRVRQSIAAERNTLAGDLERLAPEQLRLNMLIDARQKTQTTAEQALACE
jgi:murein hydrolase activator